MECTDEARGISTSGRNICESVKNAESLTGPGRKHSGYPRQYRKAASSHLFPFLPSCLPLQACATLLLCPIFFPNVATELVVVVDEKIREREEEQVCSAKKKKKKTTTQE